MITVLEGSRRATGWAIPICVIFMFLYVFIGPMMPGIWKHPGFPLEYVIGSVYYSPLGIYGSLTGISATFIAMFLIFGSLLRTTGGGNTFTELALFSAGRFRGGPAKVAVISSAMFGSISGSSIANVSVTGNYTIPLMRGLGYSPNFAGGVEAMASTGGGFTPPIMGISAFIMAELTGIPYIKIIGYAILPCILFYSGLLSGIHFEALRLNLPALQKKDIPNWRTVFTWSKIIPLFLPISILLWMLFKGYTLITAGFYACVSVLILFIFSDFSLMGIKQRFLQAGKALSEGGKSVAIIVPILVSVNMFINLLGLTGIAPKVSAIIVQMGGEHMLGALIIAALIPFVLGTALPTSATYILSVALIAPAITKLGVDIVAVHMFLIYWATLAAVTPPTCTACIIAANIGGGNWIKVAFVGMRLGIVAFIMPFLFVFEPALLGRTGLLDILLYTSSALVGSVFLASGLFGFFRINLNLWQRFFYAASGILLLYPNNLLSITGVFIGLAGLLVETIILKREQHSAP
jgi:TRAP transporter 4TM/12TM fusion protein